MIFYLSLSFRLTSTNNHSLYSLARLSLRAPVYTADKNLHGGDDDLDLPVKLKIDQRAATPASMHKAPTYLLVLCACRTKNSMSIYTAKHTSVKDETSKVQACFRSRNEPMTSSTNACRQ